MEPRENIQHEQDLFKSVADGDEHAFRQVYDRYKHRIFGFVLAIIPSHHIAEEITQEVFIKIWVAGDLLAKAENPDHYLFAMVRNKVISYLRKAAYDSKLLQQLQEGMQAPSINLAEDKLLLDEYNRLTQEAVQALSKQRKMVYELSRTQGMSLDQIAEKLHLSKNTVKNHLVEALKQIRQYLDQHGVAMLLLFFLHD